VPPRALRRACEAGFRANSGQDVSMKRRARIPSDVETAVLVASRRRCCLCVFLGEDEAVHKGQLAHLNQNSADATFKNLVWLCFNHHDEYDGTTSQAKGFTEREVRAYRDRLYAKYGSREVHGELRHEPEMEESDRLRLQYAELRQEASGNLSYIGEAWRFPLWQVANRPELFAYKAGNRCDGICLIERINLPDERVVIAAIQLPGNPGNSITNCVEELCHQVCERFAIPADRLVWLEHYDDGDGEWNNVTFACIPPYGPFSGPTWHVMDAKSWKALRLRPKKRLQRYLFEYESKIVKEFDWPCEALD
jgi:hypothetical protein